MPGWKRICCAIDFSDPSREAMVEAAELARRFEGELTLVHVHVPPPLTAPELLAPASGSLVEASAAEVQGTLAAWQAEAERAIGRAVQSVLIPGPAPSAPADEILRFVRDQRMDLIVVGTHGWRGLKRLVLGSVAERAVREAPCTVLVVRRGEGAGRGR